MTEKAFWEFLRLVISEKGRLNQTSGSITKCEESINKNGAYLGGHSVLFNGHDRLSENEIEEIGGLLFDRSVSCTAKEAILIMLAHYPKKVALDILRRYNKNPDRELKYFAETALWECRMCNK